MEQEEMISFLRFESSSWVLWLPEDPSWDFCIESSTHYVSDGPYDREVRGLDVGSALDRKGKMSSFHFSRLFLPRSLVEECQRRPRSCFDVEFSDRLSQVFERALVQEVHFVPCNLYRDIAGTRAFIRPSDDSWSFGLLIEESGDAQVCDRSVFPFQDDLETMSVVNDLQLIMPAHIVILLEKYVLATRTYQELKQEVAGVLRQWCVFS